MFICLFATETPLLKQEREEQTETYYTKSHDILWARVKSEFKRLRVQESEREREREMRTREELESYFEKKEKEKERAEQKLWEAAMKSAIYLRKDRERQWVEVLGLPTLSSVKAMLCFLAFLLSPSMLLYILQQVLKVFVFKNIAFEDACPLFLCQRQRERCHAKMMRCF